MSNWSPERPWSPSAASYAMLSRDGDEGVSEVVAHGGLLNLLVGALEEEEVLLGVEVDGGVGVEVDRVGAGDEGSVVVVGVEHLHGDGLPPAGGTAVEEARPALADAAELGLDGGHQFGFDGGAPGADIGGVDGVRVVVVGVRVLDLDGKEAWEAGRDPLLVFLVSLLLLDEVVAREVEAVGVHGLGVGVGRRGAKVLKAGGEVAVEDHLRVVSAGVLVEALGHEDDGGDVCGTAPELGQRGALDAQVTNVFGVGLGCDGRHHLVERDGDGGRAGTDVDFDGLRVEVAGRAVPVVAVAAIAGRQLDGDARSPRWKVS